MNVKLIRLLTGDEILADVLSSEDSKHIKIKDPIRIVIQPSMDPTTPKVGLAPWAPFSTDTQFVLDWMHVVAIMTPVDAMEAQYKQIFSTISTPNKPQLILPRK